MVAISLYRGNLHKSADAPRRWTSPEPKISLKDFRILLRRRARALSRLQSSSSILSNPNPNPNPEVNNNNPVPVPIPLPIPPLDNKNDCEIESLLLLENSKEKEEEKKVIVKGEDDVNKLVEKDDALVEEKNSEDVEKIELVPDPAVEAQNNTGDDATSDKEKRIKEIKEKLEILNEKKHSLVQLLKQILNAEEQLKRQNSMQGMSGRPPLPLQVDTTIDSGSMTKLNTPRMGSDGNPAGKTDVGEADDSTNHNTNSRQLPHTNSTSPSSESQQQKPASHMVPHSYRATLAVAGSPSRFAPAGQGPSSVSASGTNYVASSPSPAASGDTSVFRDVRLPSPWN